MKMDVPVFDGTHYEFWSIKMKTFLKAIDLWDVVETGTFQQEETSSSWKQWMEMKDTTTLHLIQNALTIEIFPWIASATSSKEAWDLLLVKSLGGPMFQARKLLDLKKEYDNMKMSEAETVHKFTGKLMELVFRMKSCGWEVEDKEVVKKILSSLPLRFNEALVEEAETLSISDVIDFLLVHDYNTKPVQEESIASVGVEKCLQENSSEVSRKAKASQVIWKQQEQERVIAMETRMQMQQPVPVFNGDDYELWSIKMKTLLMSRDLWDVIESRKSYQPMQEELFKPQRDLRMKDMSALYMLQMSVTDTIFLRIARATSSWQAWGLLKAEFGETERSLNLKKENIGMMYENLIMGKEESVDEFAWRVMNLANRLRFYGRNIPEDDVIFKILMKLPESFHESVSYIRSLKEVTFTEAVEMLRGDEWRQRLKKDEEASGSEKWCEFCRKKSHNTSECYSKKKKGIR